MVWPVQQTILEVVHLWRGVLRGLLGAWRSLVVGRQHGMGRVYHPSSATVALGKVRDKFNQQMEWDKHLSKKDMRKAEREQMAFLKVSREGLCLSGRR